MISVVIRNRNEADALGFTLKVLTTQYKDDISEIIIVDNNSTDDSKIVASEYGCKIIDIDEFTYGKALNMGIEEAKNDFVLLLSAHSIPVGSSFFKSSINMFKNDLLAGIRYVNSFQNYKRALDNKMIIEDGLQYGLMNACSMIRKKVWENYPFDETILASEDKDWTQKVIQKGYVIKDCLETYFYFPIRTSKGNYNRYVNETIAEYKLNDMPYHTWVKIFSVFFYKVLYIVPLCIFDKLKVEIKLLKARIYIKLRLK